MFGCLIHNIFHIILLPIGYYIIDNIRGFRFPSKRPSPYITMSMFRCNKIIYYLGNLLRTKSSSIPYYYYYFIVSGIRYWLCYHGRLQELQFLNTATTLGTIIYSLFNYLIVLIAFICIISENIEVFKICI